MHACAHFCGGFVFFSSSQAPHYDDVDIFVIQTEGSKRWRLYPPRSASEILPSVSSRNFHQDEIGQPCMDVLLRAGDFLYAPRGTIHQCVASLEEPSLHVTLSTCLGTSWSNYLSILLPRALQLAEAERVELRESLPQGWNGYMGVMHSDSSRGRTARLRPRFMDDVLQRLMSVMELELLPMDAAADQMATEYMHGCVPPPPTQAPESKKRSDFQTLLAKQQQQSTEGKKSLFKATTAVRLTRAGVARITTSVKGDVVTLHHTMSNSRLYKDSPLASIDFPIGYAETLEQVIKAYPKYVQLGKLPPPVIEGDDESTPEQSLQDITELVEQMFEEGILEVTNGAVPTEMMKTEESEEEEEEEDEEGEEEEGMDIDEEGGGDDDDGAMDDEYDVDGDADEEEGEGI
jgi:lysine-specific demethylase/histidyl-hydroxylase NO66